MAGQQEEARERDAFNKLMRLMISVHDFEQARSAATFLLEQVDNSATYPLAEMRQFRCYETTMVIAYARPFSMAKGNVGPLSWKDIKLSLSSEEKTLHQKIIQHRNTLYGHSDSEFVEMRVWMMHLTRVDADLVLPRFNEHMRFSLAEIKAIHEMALKIIHNLFHQCQSLASEFKDRFPRYDLDIETRP